MEKKHKGLTRIVRALGYSRDGIMAAFQTEASFRQEVLLCAVLIPLAFFFDVSSLERVFMIAVLVLLLVVELINTAIETIIERISPDIHPLSKKAKDVGSAAVFLMFLLVAYVWLSVLL